MTEYAIILAGGFGSRLQDVIKNIPKPMADVNGKPFLEYLFQHLLKQGIKSVVLSVGYLHDEISQKFGDSYGELKLYYSIENNPLGTGGAIKHALNNNTDLRHQECFVLNGDTYFNIELQHLWHSHKKSNANISLALKRMYEFDRYGSVIIDSNNRIIGFNEKSYLKSGLINGGIYIIEPRIFLENPLDGKFSFEHDFLEKQINDYNIYGFEYSDYFIDIGVPEDYSKARMELTSKI